MSAKKQLISVVMPVRNAGSFLVPAIESILSQSYKAFEFIIVDDASRDGTPEILKKYKKLDKRVIVFTNKKRLGIVKSVTLAMSKAKGDYIARMDADDISTPDRFKKQITFLGKHKKVLAVGGQCDLIDSQGIKIGQKKFPTQDKKIREMIFGSVPMQQPSMMVALNRLPQDFVWYDENYSSAEELELLFKLFQLGKVANLPDFILKYRIHDKNTSLKNPKGTFYLTLKTRIRAVSKYGYRPTFMGVMVTITQAILVTILPDRMIKALYAVYRGINLGKINIDVNKLTQKAFSLAET